MLTYLSKYFIKITLLTAFLGVVTTLLLYFTTLPFVSRDMPYILAFFYVFNVVVHYLLLKFSYKKMALFASYFLGATLLKLIIYFGVILWYSVKNREEAVSFIITFFLLYLIYTFFEVLSLQKFSRKVK